MTYELRRRCQLYEEQLRDSQGDVNHQVVSNFLGSLHPATSKVAAATQSRVAAAFL